MGIALSTIGIKVSYAVETEKGKRPTKNYKHIPDLKSMPSFNPAPNTADTSTFDNKEYTSAIQLLKDLGGAQEITANFTQELFDMWNGTTSENGLVNEYEAAIKDGKETWFCFDVPGFDKAAYITVQPARMGIPEATANSALETTLFITPTGEPIYAEKPTYADAALLGN